jgi:hypothetical protein
VTPDGRVEPLRDSDRSLEACHSQVIRGQIFELIGKGSLCLGFFDTCPRDAAALRMARAGGQVLDKPKQLRSVDVERRGHGVDFIAVTEAAGQLSRGRPVLKMQLTFRS